MVSTRSGSRYGDGSGSGDGYGYGSRYGDGYGDGYGDRYGYGSRYGYGYGSRYGDGYGSGSGSGDGYGYGSRYGDGYGYGYGDGYWNQVVDAAKPEEREDVVYCLWWSNKNDSPCNGGNKRLKAAPGVVHTEEGPLELCSRNTLHGTMRPEKWGGDKLWLVALHNPVVGDADKMGSLKREIICQIRP